MDLIELVEVTLGLKVPRVLRRELKKSELIRVSGKKYLVLINSIIWTLSIESKIMKFYDDMGNSIEIMNHVTSLQLGVKKLCDTRLTSLEALSRARSILLNKYSSKN